MTRTSKKPGSREQRDHLVDEKQRRDDQGKPGRRDCRCLRLGSKSTRGLKKEIVVLKSQSTKFTEDLIKQLDSLKKELAVLKSQYTKATDDLRILRFRVESLISESEPSLDSESEAVLDSATKNPETTKLSKKLSLAKLTK